LNQAGSVEDLEALTGKKRKAKLDAIRDAWQVWVRGPLHEGVGARLAEFAPKGSKVELDDTDPDGQTLLVFYPAITPADSDYIRPEQNPLLTRTGRPRSVLISRRTHWNWTFPYPV
jgi:hypothetical protein